MPVPGELGWLFELLRRKAEPLPVAGLTRQAAGKKKRLHSSSKGAVFLLSYGNRHRLLFPFVSCHPVHVNQVGALMRL